MATVDSSVLSSPYHRNFFFLMTYICGRDRKFDSNSFVARNAPEEKRTFLEVLKDFKPLMLFNNTGRYVIMRQYGALEKVFNSDKSLTNGYNEWKSKALIGAKVPGYDNEDSNYEFILGLSEDITTFDNQQLLIPSSVSGLRSRPVNFVPPAQVTLHRTLSAVEQQDSESLPRPPSTKGEMFQISTLAKTLSADQHFSTILNIAPDMFIDHLFNLYAYYEKGEVLRVWTTNMSVPYAIYRRFLTEIIKLGPAVRSNYAKQFQNIGLPTYPGVQTVRDRYSMLLGKARTEEITIDALTESVLDMNVVGSGDSTVAGSSKPIGLTQSTPNLQGVWAKRSESKGKGPAIHQRQNSSSSESSISESVSNISIETRIMEEIGMLDKVKKSLKDQHLDQAREMMGLIFPKKTFSEFEISVVEKCLDQSSYQTNLALSYNAARGDALLRIVAANWHEKYGSSMAMYGNCIQRLQSNVALAKLQGKWALVRYSRYSFSNQQPVSERYFAQLVEAICWVGLKGLGEEEQMKFCRLYDLI